MLSALSVFSRAAALSAFLSLWWVLRTLLFGGDSRSREAAAIGMALALAAGLLTLPLLARRLKPTARRLLVLGALLLIWAPCLLGLGNPFSLSELFPAPRGGAAVLRAGLELGLSLLLPALFAADLALDSLHRPFAALIGGAAGLFLQEALLLPWIGWTGSSLLWIAVLLAAAFLPTESEEEPSRLPALIGAPLSFLWGGLGAVLFAWARLFLLPRLNQGRFAEASLVGIFLLGLGIGSLLAVSLELHLKKARTRAGIFLLGAALAVGSTFWILAALAGSGAPAALRRLGGEGGRSGEVLIAMVGLSMPSVLLGLALGTVLARAGQLMAAGLGAAFGTVAAFALLPQGLSELWIPRKPGEQVMERRITPEGVLVWVRSPRESHLPRIVWNGVPLTRGSDWSHVEQEEVLLPFRITGSPGAALVAGTPTGAHLAALAIAGPRSLDLVDPAPALAQEESPKAETDLFRLLAASAHPRYDQVSLLSSPALSGEAELLLTEETLRRVGDILSPRGRAVLWIDLAALPASEVEALVRTFLGVFPECRLWCALDLYAGPLLGLEGGRGAGSRADAESGSPLFLLAEGMDLRRFFGEGPKSRLEFPRVGIGGPPSPFRPGLPSPESLRALARRLSPDPQKKGGSAYLLESLALHAEIQIPASPFSSALDRITVSEEELQHATAGLELHPGFGPLRRHILRAGQLLVEKKDYQKALDFASQWVKILPDDPDYLLLLGRIDHDLLDDELALPLLERAVALSPNSAEAHAALGRTLASLKRWKEAAISFSAAAALRPEEPLYAKETGIACFEAGDFGQSRSYLQRAAVALTGDLQVEEYLQKLEQVPK